MQGISSVRTSVPPVACMHLVIDMRWWLSFSDSDCLSSFKAKIRSDFFFFCAAVEIDFYVEL